MKIPTWWRCSGESPNSIITNPAASVHRAVMEQDGCRKFLKRLKMGKVKYRIWIYSLISRPKWKDAQFVLLQMLQPGLFDIPLPVSGMNSKPDAKNLSLLWHNCCRYRKLLSINPK